VKSKVYERIPITGLVLKSTSFIHGFSFMHSSFETNFLFDYSMIVYD